MLIRNAEVHGRGGVDVRVVGGTILEIGTGLDAAPGERVLEARGGALLPGLHDHHIHLFALAAIAASTSCGPPFVGDRAALQHALAQAPAPEGWIRGVGYHEVVAGELDRDGLDAIRDDLPARIQHRSGALWILNSRAIEALGLERADTPDGIEHDRAGRVTGRVFGLDAWLRERLPGRGGPPDLTRLGRRLAGFGVTGVTDATASNGPTELAAFERAAQSGALPQRLVVMGGEDLPAPRAGVDSRVATAQLKIMLREVALPDLDALCEAIRAAHGAQRGVAFHCVTRAELVFAVAALQQAGTTRDDRIEHGAVAPPEGVSAVAGLGLTVVTQPNFVRERGDQYLTDVEPRDRPWLYRGAAWRAEGVPLAAGTDAPFGDPNPWLAMQAAIDRRTAAGVALGASEALIPETALGLFTGPADAPGSGPRPLAPGAPADLCLLDRPWREARDQLGESRVRATLCGGRLVFDDEFGPNTATEI